MFGLRDSKWSYETGATGGVGLGPVLASGGMVKLTDPAGNSEKFHYSGIGMGLGRSMRLPGIPDLNLPRVLHLPRSPAATGSSVNFASTGAVYMTSAFQRGELTRSDLVGGTIYVDAGAGVIVDGLNASVMLLGLNTALLLLAMAMPGTALLGNLVHAAPAVLVMVGASVGLQSGTWEGRLLQGQLGIGAGILVGSFF